MLEDQQLSENGVPDGLPPIAGVSIDPSTWVEPKVEFPGKVIVSDYRWANQKYLDMVIERIMRDSKYTLEQVLASLAQATPGNHPNIPQWNCQVERLDAAFQLPDGSNAPATRFGGIDMVQWNNREKRFMAVVAGGGKAPYITGEWKRVFGTIDPPSVLVGRLAEFDFYPSKRFGGPQPAKNVLVPTKVLPPDYVFTGEKQIIVVTREQAEGQASGDAPLAGAPDAGQPSSALRYEDALTQLVPLLDGKDGRPAAAGALIGALPQHLRQSEIVSGLATGELITKLVAEGKISLNADGIIAIGALAG